MTLSDDDRIPARLIACGIFRHEFELLPAGLRRSFKPAFLDSMLHMDPARLDCILSSAMEGEHNGHTVIAYGDCCPHMRELSSRRGTARTTGINCCEIYLGEARYRQLRKEGVFFLMPEWAKRWKHIFTKQLGLEDRQLAHDFMAQSMRRAVYIDTGTVPVPAEALAGFSDHTGLVVTIETTGPGFFAEALERALERALLYTGTSAGAGTSVGAGPRRDG